MALVGVSLLPSRSLTVELDAEAAHAAAAGVGERAERLAIEEISRPAGQPLFDRGGSLWRHHVKQLDLRAGRFNTRRFAWREKHPGTVLRSVRLPVEADGARLRLDDVDKVVVGAGLDIELPAFRHCPLIDVQVFRSAQRLAADRPFKPGCDRLGLGLVPIDDGNVFDVRHGHSSWSLPQFADALPGPLDGPSISRRRIAPGPRCCTCG